MRRTGSHNSPVLLQTVAAGKYCEIFHVSGLPDWVVLSSGKNFCCLSGGRIRQVEHFHSRPCRVTHRGIEKQIFSDGGIKTHKIQASMEVFLTRKNAQLHIYKELINFFQIKLPNISVIRADITPTQLWNMWLCG